MRSNFIFFLFVIFILSPLKAENLNIQAETISIDKDTKLTIFKDKVVATDEKKNILKTEYAVFDKTSKRLSSKGETTLTTSEGYLLKGANIFFDNQNNIVSSKDKAIMFYY